MDFDFRKWITDHSHEEYTIETPDHDTINLIIEYGIATIRFTEVEESTIVEFSVTAKKDDSVKFYLHFELNDEAHAKKLYDEMVESLLDLKNEKTVRVLLSCSAGLTTYMFAENLNSTAQLLNLDYQFNAVSYVAIYEEVDNYDVILIAPQIGYMLNKLKESLPDKLVLQVPTATFASYDALAAIRYIQDELEKYNEEKNKKEEEKCSCHCTQYEKRILSIVIMNNRAQSRTYYRLSDQCEIIDSNLIIKPKMDLNDIHDIINTMLLKHNHIDLIALATPGIVDDNVLRYYTGFNEGNPVDMKETIERKYNIPLYMTNNTNAAVKGFSLEHPEYKNIVFHSQPFGYGIGGQGIIVNNELVSGNLGIAGEVKFFIKRMQFSDEIDKLCWSQQGTMEIISKALLPTICVLGPEAIAIRSPMTPDIQELKQKLTSFIPEEYLPEFYYIKEASSYMLDGLTELCVEDYEKNDTVD